MKNFAIYATEEQKMGNDLWMRKSDNLTRDIFCRDCEIGELVTIAILRSYALPKYA